MKTTYIVFLTHEDRVKGFYELMRKTRLDSFRGEVYRVPVDALKLLDDLHVGYRVATDAEVKNALDQVRNPPASVP
ncbi:MAG: hypothetical protein U0793_34600 [Gemmataceae bacterium]